MRFKSLQMLETFSNCLGPYPIGWDKVANKYYKETNFQKLIFPYMYFEYIAATVVFSISGFVLLRQIFSPNPSTTILHIMFITMYIIAFSFFAITSSVLFHERTTFVAGYNFNLEFEKTLQKRKHCRNKNRTHFLLFKI